MLVTRHVLDEIRPFRRDRFLGLSAVVAGTGLGPRIGLISSLAGSAHARRCHPLSVWARGLGQRGPDRDRRAVPRTASPSGGVDQAMPSTRLPRRMVNLVRRVERTDDPPRHGEATGACNTRRPGSLSSSSGESRRRREERRDPSSEFGIDDRRAVSGQHTTQGRAGAAAEMVRRQPSTPLCRESDTQQGRSVPRGSGDATSAGSTTGRGHQAYSAGRHRTGAVGPRRR